MLRRRKPTSTIVPEDTEESLTTMPDFDETDELDYENPLASGEEFASDFEVESGAGGASDDSERALRILVE
jgi:hypothetical protein